MHLEIFKRFERTGAQEPCVHNRYAGVKIGVHVGPRFAHLPLKILKRGAGALNVLSCAINLGIVRTLLFPTALLRLAFGK